MDILGSWIQIHMKTDADPKHWPKKGAGADPKKSALASAPPQHSSQKNQCLGSGYFFSDPFKPFFLSPDLEPKIRIRSGKIGIRSGKIRNPDP